MVLLRIMAPILLIKIQLIPACASRACQSISIRFFPSDSIDLTRLPHVLR